ncbi:hypothetical protein [Methylobacterium frigidaeris]|uniref:hypothetical protein n=1 Tax=Methylobacterium frigidaeris TaxID=2038277 RepID=UPI001EDDC835|nr:hypothetical protein [Methylobacterium frigidaeris]
MILPRVKASDGGEGTAFRHAHFSPVRKLSSFDEPARPAASAAIGPVIAGSCFLPAEPISRLAQKIFGTSRPTSMSRDLRKSPALSSLSSAQCPSMADHAVCLRNLFKNIHESIA